jgi:hypothetical protein
MSSGPQSDIHTHTSMVASDSGNVTILSLEVFYDSDECAMSRLSNFLLVYFKVGIE